MNKIEQDGFVALQTSRLLLRDHRMEDLNTHHRLLSDPKVMYYLPDLMTTSLDSSRKNLTESMEQIGRPDRWKVFLRIEERGTGDHVGEVGYTVEAVTPVGKLVGLGYFICPQYWGRGYTTEAVAELLRYAFIEDGVYRVSTGCLADNKGSERVMQKCGMVLEARFKEKVWHDGKLRDRMEYRLLKEEWEKLKQAE